MKGLKGEMNIDFDEYYNEEDDVYYVTFKTGEPSMVSEIDDTLLLEVGLFSNLPTGFRILNYKKQRIGAIGIITKKVRKSLQSTLAHLPQTGRAAEQRVERAIGRALAPC